MKDLKLVRESKYSLVNPKGEELRVYQKHKEESEPFSLSEYPKLASGDCDLAYLEEHFLQFSSDGDFDRELPKCGEVYKHFKGKYVSVLCIAKFSENPQANFVVYSCSNGVYARPLSMFMSLVDKEKYPDVGQKYRFEKIS